MIPNINTDTGIPYGYISANDLDSDVVHELLYGATAVNRSYADSLEEFVAQERAAFDEEHAETDEEFDLDACEERHSDQYYGEEERIDGTLDGVMYATSWMGGALHFFILRSPVTAYGRECSLCVPNAMNCSQVGEGKYEGYFVPSSWLYNAEISA